MKKCMFKVLAVIFAACLFVSCSDDEPQSPAVGGEAGILKVTFEGIILIQDAKIAGLNIDVLVPKGTNVKELKPIFELAEGSSMVSPAVGNVIDCSNVIPIRIKGGDGKVKTYQMTVRIDLSVAYGFGSYEEIGFKSHAQLGFKMHCGSGVAISNNNVVIVRNEDKITYPYYNLVGLDKEGELSLEGDGFTVVPGKQIASDEQGHLIASNVVGDNGNKLYIYRWDNVTAKPTILVEWDYDFPANENYSNPTKPWEQPLTGHNIISIKGDLNKDAVIMATVACSPIVHKWVIKGGKLKNMAPDKVKYVFSSGRKNWEMLCGAIPLSNQENTEFLLFNNFERSLAKSDGTAYRLFSTGEFAGMVGTTFEFNHATYIASLQYGYDMDNTGMLSLYDITRTSYIDDYNRNYADRIAGGIHYSDPEDPTKSIDNFWAFNGRWIPSTATEGNANNLGCVDAKISADKSTVTIAAYAQNGGLILYKFSTLEKAN